MKFINIEDYNGIDDKSIENSERQIEIYNDYFNVSVKPYLSKLVIDKYLKYNGFHDWYIVCIENSTVPADKNDLVVSLYKSNENTIVKIRYENIRALKIDFNAEHFKPYSYDQYVIDEFISLDNSYFSHEVFCPSGSMYYVEFSAIKITENDG